MDTLKTVLLKSMRAVKSSALALQQRANLWGSKFRFSTSKFYRNCTKETLKFAANSHYHFVRYSCKQFQSKVAFCLDCDDL